MFFFSSRRRHTRCALVTGVRRVLFRSLAGYNFAGGRGNITVAGEYNQEAGLTNFARPGKRLNSFFTTPLADSPFDNVYIGDRRLPSLSAFGVPLVTDFIRSEERRVGKECVSTC